MHELTINEQESINGGGWWNWQTFMQDLGECAEVGTFILACAAM